MEKGWPEVPIYPQTLSNESRFRIKLKLSGKKQAKSSDILANSPQRNSIQNQIQTFWMEKAGQKILYFCEFSSTKFHLESNLKFSEWKKQDRKLYIFANFPQRNSI